MPRKYRNQPVIVDGARFASKLEARRWQELRLLERAGQIHYLQRQVRLPLHVCGVRIGYYVADYVYSTTPHPPLVEQADGGCAGLTDSAVVEDTKGVETSLFKWKAKHVAAQYGHEIRRVHR